MADEDQQRKIISLLATAHMLANDLNEGTLAYYIERALDEAQAMKRRQFRSSRRT
jgi:hypothetical protein